MTALTASNQINTWDGKLVGIVDAGTRDLEDVWLTMPLKDAHILTNTKRISMLGITLKNPDHAIMHFASITNPIFWYNTKDSL